MKSTDYSNNILNKFAFYSFFLRFRIELRINAKTTYNTFYSGIKREKNAKKNMNFFLKKNVWGFFFPSLLYRIIPDLYPNYGSLTPPKPNRNYSFVTMPHTIFLVHFFYSHNKCHSKTKTIEQKKQKKKTFLNL